MGLLRLSHHHFTKLIEIHGSRTVFVELLEDSLQFLLCERRQELTDQASQRLGGDVAVTLLVVYPATTKCSLEPLPTRAFSLLKAPTGAFTLKNLLRHYSEWAFKHSEPN